MKTTASLICALGLIITGCQFTTPTAIPTTPAPSFPTQEDSQMQPSLTGLAPADTDTQTIIEKSKNDLAQRLGVSVDKITVFAMIGQEFSTDAFYCRVTKDRITRDASPTQTLGWVILLDVSEHRYEYHASGRTIIFCRSLL